MIKKFTEALVKRREDGENEKGFTLIELMVVIIIIGILAAIAIPAFLNQRQSAWDASVKSDLSSAAIAAASYATAHNGSYTGMTYQNLTGTYGWVVSSGNKVDAPNVNSAGTSYSIDEYNSNSTSSNTYTVTNGTITGPTSKSITTVN